MSRALMFQGTGSDVGKSVLVAGLCRALKHRGLAVRPFKPQNMSNNAAVADPGADGKSGEIGRAQWLQALACGVAPNVHMNPVLLKPQSETGSQVVVQGQVLTTARARDYLKLKPQLMQAVMDSYQKMKGEADIVLVEGAGSPAEINLRAGDIANMGFATRAKVPVVLVGDIDRGGVIASLVGTHAILPETDREMIAGYLINKFRGDVSLFDEGLKSITGFTGWRSFGVVPWLAATAKLPAEDSVALDHMVRSDKRDAVKIAVPVMGKIANFDDLDPLKAEDGVEVVFIRKGEELPGDAEAIILPGSKSTIADLIEFRANGWEAGLRQHVARGGQVFGICGGYQMLGRVLRDPGGIEGPVREISGLGLLDVETVLEDRKIVRNALAASADGIPLRGYEIHMGRTSGPDCTRAMVELDGRPDGAVSADGKVRGCYLHGLFDSGEFRRAFVESLGGVSHGGNHLATIEAALDDIAMRLEQSLDIDGLLAVSR
ncbi:MAG: cobyric acid synthase [Nitratireductor sp.]